MENKKDSTKKKFVSKILNTKVSKKSKKSYKKGVY